MKSFKFYIRMDDTVYGPYSLQEYHDLDVPDDTEVMEGSVGEWMLASDYPSYEELKARENGYKLMPDGSIEKIKEEEAPDDYEEVPTSEAIDEPHTPLSSDGSPKYSDQPLYVEISTAIPNTGWNWGAFMFNWIWAIFNGLYWPLIIIPVAIIPYIGGLASLVFCIVLGYKGNEWAWQAKTWNSVEHFNDVQHRWSVAAGIYVLVIIGFVILAFLIGFGSVLWKNNVV